MEEQTENQHLQKKINRRTFISFSAFTALTVSVYGLWRWLYNAPPEQKGVTAGLKSPLRKALNANELALRKIYSNKHLVETYPISKAAKKVRQNGNVGLQGKLTEKEWNLTFIKENSEILQLTLNDLKALPKTEIVFDFKCVEGWDQISHWGGVKMVDLINYYKLNSFTEMEYLRLSTPDKKYYVGLDMPSAVHPQTLLCYEMNGKALPMAHGFPLRLIIPVKYGIKNLKRVSTITFSNERPPDYWAERGYDYYSGW